MPLNFASRTAAAESALASYLLHAPGNIVKFGLKMILHVPVSIHYAYRVLMRA